MAHPRPNNTLASVAVALAMSVGVHLLLWPVGDRVVGWGFGNAKPIPRANALEVALVPETDAEAQDRPKTEPPDQLVNLDRVVKERAPDDARFVSEFDNQVERETKAANRRPQPGESSAPRGSPDADGQTPDPSERSAQERNEAAKPLPLDPTRPNSDGEGSADQADPMRESPDGRAATRAGPVAALSPRGMRGLPDALRQQWGTPGSYDAIDDVEEGEENILNSKRWKYASFFNRVRDQIAEQWQPEVVHKANDPEGRIFGTQTRRTELIISLNGDGSLNNIRLDTASGARYLDEEAIRAVRAAAPFSNPPPELIDGKTGRIEFGFAFIFEIHRGRRIHRYFH